MLRYLCYSTQFWRNKPSKPWSRRSGLDLDSAKLLANALVFSRFDYYNSLSYGIAETDLTKLQHILNRLAHVVTMSPPFTSSVPLLFSLHWLPVKYRVDFKICLRLFMKNNPFNCAPWLPLLFHHTHWEQTEESLCRPLGSRPTLAQGIQLLCLQPDEIKTGWINAL